MPTGQLKTWNEKRGYGFITQDDATDVSDVFVHVTAFELAGIVPKIGDAFSYAIGTRNDKPIAIHLQHIGSPDYEAVDAH